MNQRLAATAKKPSHFVTHCPNLGKDKPKKESSKNKFKKSLMTTWEDLVDDYDGEDTDMNLMTSTSSDDTDLCNSIKPGKGGVSLL